VSAAYDLGQFPQALVESCRRIGWTPGLWGGRPMAQSSERRRGSRIRTRFETVYSGGRQDGSGILSEISYSGALLTGTSLQPRLGSKVRVYILLSDPFEVVGKVVRYVESGFAIEYADLSSELRRLIDDAAAIVGEVKPSER